MSTTADALIDAVLSDIGFTASAARPPALPAVEKSTVRVQEPPFSEVHPALYGWLVRVAPRFEFAASLLQSIEKWGGLTPNQLAAAQRCYAREAPASVAPEAVTRLPALHSVMQQHAKFYAGDVTLSRRNDDQLVWIKHANAEKVVGKIDGGVLSLWARAGVDMQQVRSLLQEFEGAPLQAAMKYGKLSGRCCSCGRELTNDGSIEAGIGPVCAQKFTY